MSTLLRGGPLCEPDCRTRGGPQRIFSFFLQKIQAQLEREDAGAAARSQARGGRAASRGRGGQEASAGRPGPGALTGGTRCRHRVRLQWQTTSNGLISQVLTHPEGDASRAHSSVDFNAGVVS